MIHRLNQALVLALGFGGLGWAMLSLPAERVGLTVEAEQSLERSGVTNPVTAVLLNYRAYDTLLEIAVLLMAIVAVWSLRRADASEGRLPAPALLLAFLRWLIPLLVVMAGYLLWVGAFAPGGAFQGGALVGGALVLGMLAGWHWRLARDGWLRAGLWVGLLVFLVAGVGVMLLTGRMLEYPVAQAKNIILVIETAALISIGLTLGALFLGGRPVVQGADELGEER